MLHHRATSVSGCASRMKPTSNCSSVMLMYGPIKSKTALIRSSSSGGNEPCRIGPGRSRLGSMCSRSLMVFSLVAGRLLVVQAGEASFVQLRKALVEHLQVGGPSAPRLLLPQLLDCGEK